MVTGTLERRVTVINSNSDKPFKILILVFLEVPIRGYIVNVSGVHEIFLCFYLDVKDEPLSRTSYRGAHIAGQLAKCFSSDRDCCEWFGSAIVYEKENGICGQCLYTILGTVIGIRMDIS